MPAPASPIHEAVDTTARSQITGLRGEFHEFRVEIKSDVDTMRNEIGSGFSKVFNRMDSDARANMQASKSGIGLIASFSLGVVGLAFSFTTIITAPLRDQDARQTDLLDKQFARAYDLSRSDVDRAVAIGKMMDSGDKVHDRVVSLERYKDDVSRTYGERIARIEGLMADMRKHRQPSP